jgi:hypothetical protein
LIIVSIYLDFVLFELWLAFLCHVQQWNHKDRNAYETMVRKSLHNQEVRAENPIDPAWIHSVAFFYQEDNNLRAMGQNLAWTAQGAPLALYY